MLDAFSTGLIFPAICLAALGFAVPRVLAVWWPEGVKWLMGLALVSTFVMTLCGGVFFALLYGMQGISLSDLWQTQGVGTLTHFAGLSLVSALLWAPLMVLSLIGVPKNWTQEVW